MVISGLKVLARKCLHKLSEAFFVCFCQPATNNRLLMFVRRVGKHFSENRGLGGGKFAQNLEYTFYYSPIHLMKLNYMNQKGEGGVRVTQLNPPSYLMHLPGFYPSSSFSVDRLLHNCLWRSNLDIVACAAASPYELVRNTWPVPHAIGHATEENIKKTKENNSIYFQNFNFFYLIIIFFNKVYIFLYFYFKN